MRPDTPSRGNGAGATKRFVLIGSEAQIALDAAKMLLADPAATLAAVFAGTSGGRLARYAQEHGVAVFPSERFRADGEQLCRDLACDWLINAYGTVIVPPAMLRLFPGQALNVHPGPLPEYGGLHMNQWALRNGETRFGATIHLMDEQVDTGAIVRQAWFDIAPTDTGLSLFTRTQQVATALLREVLGDILAGRALRPVAQDLTRLRVYRHAEALDGRIDWRWPAKQIVDFVRAGNYRPFASPTYTAYVEQEGARIEILKACVGAPAAAPCGTVVEVGEDGPRIACGEGGSVVLARAEAQRVLVDVARWRRWLDVLPQARLSGRQDGPTLADRDRKMLLGGL
jgi:methionyl-tRNA formyltransferase